MSTHRPEPAGSLGLMSEQARAAFNAIAREITRRGSGILLTEISTIRALARELTRDEPDQEKVVELAGRLRIEVEELATLTETESWDG